MACIRVSSSLASSRPCTSSSSCTENAACLRASHGQLLGCQLTVDANTQANARHRQRKPYVCASSDPSGLGGSMYEEFKEDDQEYVKATLLPALEVKSGSEGFLVKMADGSMLKCAHNQAEGIRLPDYAAQPAMVLKLEDGSDILLPLIVLEHPRATLMEALKNVPLARPTVYLVIRDMVELMGYQLKLVRITHRVCEAYYARIYLAKAGDESGAVISLDLRPSDAINLAVRSKVPIQVNKALAVGDGVRQVSMVPRGPARSSVRAVRSYHFTWTDDDRGDTKDSTLESELTLLRLMEMAAQEQRYADAARIRDDLNEFRKKSMERDEA